MKSLSNHINEHFIIESQTTQILEAAKDDKRISDIISKANGNDGKALQLSKSMATKITSVSKAEARAEAAYSVGRTDIGEVFANRAKELGSTEDMKNVEQIVSPEEEEFNKRDLYWDLEKSKISKAKIQKMTDDQFASLYVGKSLVLSTNANWYALYINNDLKKEYDENDKIAGKTSSSKSYDSTAFGRTFAIITDITDEYANIAAISLKHFGIWNSFLLKAISDSRGKQKIHISKIKEFAAYAASDKTGMMAVLEDQDMTFKKLFGSKLSDLISDYRRAEFMRNRMYEIFRQTDKYVKSYDKKVNITKSSNMIIRGEGGGTAYAVFSGGKGYQIRYGEHRYESYTSWYGEEIKSVDYTVNDFVGRSQYHLTNGANYSNISKEDAQELLNIMPKLIELYQDANKKANRFASEIGSEYN